MKFLLTTPAWYVYIYIHQLSASADAHNGHFLALRASQTKEMMSMFQALDQQYHPPIENPELDVEGFCSTVVGQQGFLGPWR